MSYIEDYIKEIQDEIERKNAKKINDMLSSSFVSNADGRSECAGTYHVSGYTREDGVKVDGYVRTCGAAHHGMRNNNYEKYLDEATKKVTQSEMANEKIPLKDYYKIALDLADKSKTVQSNKRNKVFKADDLPKDVNQKVVLEKVARGLGLDLNNPRGLEKAKNTTVVVPTDSSQLVEVLKRSEKIKDLLKKEYSNILDGKYEGKFYDNGITFELPNKNESLPEALDKSTLFGTIHNADIYDLKTNSDGSVSFVISDFYDFEYMKGNEYNSIKEVNNSAYRQQQTERLTPYALYIPVVISTEQLKEILSNSK